MNCIIYDDLIFLSTPIHNNIIWDYYYEFIQKLNHRDCVKFSLFCTKYVNPNSIESNLCIGLIEKWLKDKKSITQKKLQDIGHNIDYKVSDSVYLESIFSYAIDTIIQYSPVTYPCCACMRNTIYYLNNIKLDNNSVNDLNLYLQTLLRTTKQYNTKIHNNQHYESILKEIIKEDIDNLTDTDYNMLTDISQEYYNINPNITNKRIFIELLRREYE